MAQQAASGQVTKQRFTRLLKELGIRIADATTYPVTREGPSVNGQTMIIGYLPGRAAVIEASYVHLGEIPRGVTFAISGEFTPEGYEEAVDENGEVMPLLQPRGFTYPPETEVFSVRRSIDGGTATATKLAVGQKFLGAFIENYAGLLQPAFTQNIPLWFTPIFADECKDLEEKYGTDSDEPSRHFASQVVARLPKGLFVPEQEF